jgi:hypothetical protein
MLHEQIHLKMGCWRAGACEASLSLPLRSKGFRLQQVLLFDGAETPAPCVLFVD